MSSPIAITGLGAILPGAADVAQAWQMILGGRDEIKEIPAGQWLIDDYYDPDPRAPDRCYARRGAFLPDVAFDPMAFGVVPTAIEATDTTQLLSLIVAGQVLRDAGTGARATLDRERVSVILGATAYLELAGHMAARVARPHWLAGLRAAGVPESTAREYCDQIAAQFVPWQEDTFPGLLPNVIAGRVASRFDLHGTNHTTDAACASALAAVSNAVDELTVGRADLVIAGGADTLSDPTSFMCFSKTPALSPTGDCRPFSDQADGTMLGQGVVMFALKRLADAERDGDRVYATITGVGTASDGRGNAIYAPLPAGQQRALRRAYQAAGYGPETVELVEAHGTGTKAGDRAEFGALAAVFGEAGAGGQWCALGSIKSQIGHAKGAAGAAGLLKAVLALHHKTLPPTIKVARPNPELNIEASPFYLNTAARPWVHAPDSPRRASVSSFGFGGSNFHVALQEYRTKAPDRIRTSPAELILLSARTAAELTTAIPDGASLAEVARRGQLAFDPAAAHRLAFVASGTEQVSAMLARLPAALAGGAIPPGVHYAAGEPLRGQVAFLFPGQGAQYPGMGADVAMHCAAARRAWDELGTLEFDGEALHRVVFPPPAFASQDGAAQQARLTATEWAQPALAAHSLALYAVLAELGLAPDCVAGHSFGELVALHVAGAYDAASLMALARRRGELMREAASVPGGMLAVAAGNAKVTAHLAASGVPDIWVANSNAPDQTILSGSLDALRQMTGYLAAAGVAATRLRAAAAFHSPLVAAAAAPLSGFLARLPVSGPVLPVYGNADAACYPADPEAVRGGIGRHLRSAVLFQDQVEAMYAAGVRTFVEVGASGPLTGLAGRILGDRPHVAVALDRAAKDGMTALYEGLGRLAVNGVALDWAAHWSGFAPDRDGAAEPAPKMAVTINGGNYGRPYPPANGRQEGDDPMIDDQARARDEVHRRAAESHARYQQLMTDAHLAFLRVCTDSLGEPSASGQAAQPAQPVPGPFVPAPVTPAPIAPEPVTTAPVTPEPVTPEPVTPEPVIPEPGRPGTDITAVVMSVVADRTGYPAEALEPSMRLEADLGIDSIKRVEILAGLRRELGELDAPDAELAALRTLRDIIGKLEEAGAGAAPPRETEPPSQAAGPASGELIRLDVTAVPAPPTGLAMPGLRGGTIVVADDGSGLGKLTASRLNAHGIAATPVGSSADVPGDVTGVILLSGLAAVATPDEAFAQQRRAFRAARKVARRFTERGGVFVTVQDTGGDFGLAGGPGARAWTGGLAALARTAAKEWPTASVKAIDCATEGRTPEDIADAIAAELVAGGPQSDVGLRADGTRITLTDRPNAPASEPAEPAAAIDADSVLVVSGGGRGITASCLLDLARRCRPRFVLLGRTELTDEPPELAGCRDEPGLLGALAATPGIEAGPAELRRQAQQVLANREIKATLAALEKAGSPARYLAVDVTNAGAVAAALEQVRGTWGPVTGVIHAAGQLADKRIEDKTDEQFDRVFGIKAAGLHALLTATAADPLRTICVFSSVAGRYGNPGQCDYAMGNEVLTQVAAAEAARRPDCAVVSIAWGPWQGGMVTDALAAHFTAAGVPLIDPASGAAAFTRELTGAASSRIVVAAATAALGTRRDLPAAEIRVTRQTHPQLEHHVIEGQPVLPMAQVLEWFTAAATAWFPAAPAIALREVRVLRKAVLPGLAAAGHRFTIRGSRAGTAEDPVTVELYGDGEHPHYRAFIDPTIDTAAPRPVTLPAPGGLVPTRRDRTYDGATLFHGPLFQVLTDIEGVSLEGAKGTVTDLRAMGWPAGTWQTDPAAIDGGVQLAVVWAEEILGETTLPMSVGEFRLVQAGAIASPITCVVRSVPANGDNTRCHVALTSSDGRNLAELRDLELVRRPA